MGKGSILAQFQWMNGHHKDRPFPSLRSRRLFLKTQASAAHLTMAGSLLADLSRLGPENGFTDLLLTAAGGPFGMGFAVFFVLQHVQPV